MGSCACPTRPPAHPAKNTAGLKPDPPTSPATVWPAQGSRLPDAGLPPHSHALGAPPTTPRTRCKRGLRARVAKPGNPSPGPRVWACTLPPAVSQPHCPTRAARVAQGPVQPSVDTLPCQALDSVPSPRHPGPSVFLRGFVSQLQAALGRYLLDRTPAS